MCSCIPTISNLVSSEVVSRDSIEIPTNIKLADPEFHSSRPVDLLIESGATLFSDGRIDFIIK